MKFFSRINNFRLILTPSVPGNPYMQIPPVYGKTVKFTDGMVDLNPEIPRDKEIIDLLLHHEKLGKDFFRDEHDPFEENRQESEPVHDTQEVRDGRPGKVVSHESGRGRTLEEQLLDMAKEMAKEMAIEMVKKSGSVPSPSEEPVSNPGLDDEPMDHGVAEEIMETERVEKRTEVPSMITAPSLDEQGDDGENPLESTLPVTDSSREKSGVEVSGKKAKGKK